jgi:hypothetical protein
LFLEASKKGFKEASWRVSACFCNQIGARKIMSLSLAHAKIEAIKQNLNL